MSPRFSWITSTVARAERLLRQTEDNLAKGFRAIKMKVGRERLAEDTERVGAMRELLGPDVPLMVDANMRWSADQAIRAARKGAGLAVVDLNMIEEEIGEGSLVRLSPVQPIGPFGYWLDVEPESVAVEPVVAFAAWLREQAGRRG